MLSQYSQSGQLIYDENHRASGRKATEYVYLAGSLISTRARNIDTNAWVVSFQHTDALGSPVAVTNTAGAVIERTNWEPYGAAINRPAYDGVGYTGHVMDGATGLTYMQQRYYDPIIGRFLSVDPVTANSGTGANFNRYWYANNNPYSFTDPDGRCGTRIKGHVAASCKSTSFNSSTLVGKSSMRVGDNVHRSGNSGGPTLAEDLGSFGGGVVKGVASYGKGVIWDLPKHVLQRLGLMGEQAQRDAESGALTPLTVGARISQDPEKVIKYAGDAYIRASPGTQRELQGRITGRLLMGSLVTGRTAIVGPAISIAAVAGNALEAGTTYQNEAAVMDAIIYGERP